MNNRNADQEFVKFCEENKKMTVNECIHDFRGGFYRSLGDFIIYLQELKDDAEEKGFSDLSISYDEAHSEYGDKSEIYVCGNRIETESEFARRMKKLFSTKKADHALAQKLKEERKKLYKELKKEFEK